MIISYSLILEVNGKPFMTAPNMNSYNIFSRQPENRRVSTKLDPILFEDFPSMPSRDIQQRNVIMPRICYFSRVTKTGVHQKLCLPYNDIIQS
jgi:hypothetical protein